jgi:hypothetical protein
VKLRSGAFFTSSTRLFPLAAIDRLRNCGLAFFFLAVLTSGAAPSEYYRYQIIAKTGQAVAGQTSLTGIGDSPSVNAAGVVAFVGQFTGGEGVVAGDGTNPLVLVSPNRVSSNIFFGRSVQIADDGHIIATDRAVGSPPLYWIRSWDANSPGSSTTITTTNVPFPTFDAVFTFGSINNNSQAAFGALQHNSANTLLVTSPVSSLTVCPLSCNSIVMPQNSLLRPMIADDGRVAVKFGIGVADPIRLYSFDLSSFVTIADSADFVETGNSPGVSENGQIVTFYGNVTVNGAVKYGPGKGIFASIDVGTGTRTIVRIAGTSPGGFTNFVDGRVGVNGTQTTQRSVTIVYRATHTTGDGVYSTRLSLFGSSTVAFAPAKPQQFSVGLPTPVVKVGDSIPGLTGIVQSFNLGDPVNSRDRGDVAIWVSTSASEQAVVRARPQLVLFLDFDPVNHFTAADEPLSIQLLSGYSVAADWQGTMADVLASSGRGFNAAAVQNNIVDKVQAAFDQLTSGGPGTNVNVLGKTSDTTPTEGPVVRVFIGDGPLGAANCNGINANQHCQLAGISPVIDIFNQFAVIEDWTDTNNNGQVDPGEFVDLNANGVRDVADYNRKAVMIFVDNIFRVSDVNGDGIPDGLFTDSTGNAVPLSSTGPDAISQAEVELAISSTISHEVGHALGLRHLIKTPFNQPNQTCIVIMHGNVCIKPTDAIDELRVPQQFGNVSQLLSPAEFAQFPGATENSGARLALSLGRDKDSLVLVREQPSVAVLQDESRNVFKIATAGLPSIAVQRAFVAITPSGSDDRLPEIIDLGSGNLLNLLQKDLWIRSGDQIAILASTAGSIDIFTTSSGVIGNLGTVSVNNALALLTDSRLRSNLFDSSGNPVTPSMDIYQIQGGIPVLVGSTNTAGAATQMAANAGTTPQSATISTAFANALAVTVRDAGNNPVSGVNVAFTAPGSGASGVFSNSTTTITVATNASGVAAAPFTANGTTGGPYTVTAAATALTTVNFSLTNTAGAATTITNVSSTNANGTYGAGAALTVTITFSKAVVVTGAPLLALNSGGSATYSTGSGSATLTFAYTVGAGQNSQHLDATSTGALTLNGGTMVDGASQAAVLTLPVPGAAGSLGANKSIVIDTVAPTVVSYKAQWGSQSYNVIGTARNRVPWQITGIQVVFSKSIANADLNSLSAAGLIVTGLNGLGTNTLTWTINPLALGTFSTTLAGSGVDAVKDAAGNALTGGAGFSQNLKILYGDFNDDGNVNSQDIVTVNNAVSAPYNILADLNGDGVVNITDVQIVRTRVGTSLP